jgi:predicted secreted protein
MAKLDANLYQCFIESSTPGTFNVIKGQRSSSVGASLNTYSIATKDSGGWDINGAGLLQADMSVELVPDLPDSTGYTRCETLFAAKTATRVQWRFGSTVVFDAPVLITSINRDFPFNDAVGSQISFVLTGAPTVNALS